MLLWCPNKLGIASMGKAKTPKKPDDLPAASSPSLAMRLGIALALIAALAVSSGFVISQLSTVASPDEVFIPYFLTISNPILQNETMYIAVNLEARGSIAAQKDITAFIRLAPNHQLRNDEGYGYTDLPKDYSAVFVGSFCTEGTTIDKYGSQNACSVILNQVSVKDKKSNPNGINYEGTDTIKYPAGGSFGILLTANANETVGTIDVASSPTAFINIVSLEDSQQAEYSRAAVWLALPLAIIGAAISLFPILGGRK